MPTEYWLLNKSQGLSKFMAVEHAILHDDVFDSCIVVSGRKQTLSNSVVCFLPLLSVFSFHLGFEIVLLLMIPYLLIMICLINNLQLLPSILTPIVMTYFLIVTYLPIINLISFNSLSLLSSSENYLPFKDPLL